MRSVLLNRAVSVPLVIGGCAILPAAVLHFLGPRQVEVSSTVHFLPIAISAGLAAGAAVALSLVGKRRGDGRAVLVGTAFSTMAALLAVHGLTTPGFLAGDNGVVAFSGAATLPVGGAVLALSAMPEMRRPRNVTPLLWLQGVLLLLIAGLGLAGILAPEIVPGVPEARSTGAWILLVVGLLFFGILARRAARTVLLTHRAADLLVALGTVLLGVALVPALIWTYHDLGWWLGHGFELIGIALAGTPVALDLHRGVQSRPLAGDLRGTELVRAPPMPSSARRSAHCSCGWPRRTPTPRSTPAASHCAPFRRARSSASLPAASASSPSAGSCTTSASCRYPTRSCRSPRRSTTRSSRSSNAIPRLDEPCWRRSAASPHLSHAWCSTITSAWTDRDTRAA